MNVEIREVPAEFKATDGLCPPGSDDVLIWYAQAVWAARWFCASTFLVGLVAGVYLFRNEPLMRTVALIRGQNPAVGYMHRNYWDGVSRTIQSQLRVAAESLRNQFDVAVKAEAEPWMVRVEVRHGIPGAGAPVIEKLIADLPCMRGRSGDNALEAEASEVNVQREMELTAVLDELQEQLSEVWPGWNEFMPEGETGADLQPSRVFFSEGMLRLPFDDVSQAARFRRLTRTVSQWLSATSEDAAGPSTEMRLQLVRLQQSATRLFLLHWAGQDLFSVASDSHSVVLDSVQEISEPPLRGLLKCLFVGGVGSLATSILLVVPWFWLRQNRRRITRATD